MNNIKKESSNRIFFFDNLRYLMILLVLVIHAGASYSIYTTGWVIDDKNSVFVDFIFRSLGIFLMPMLFFISGYFAIPSIKKVTIGRFIVGKFRRLGIPWLLGIILLGPLQVYIHKISRGNPTELLSIFTDRMNQALLFNTGIIRSFYQFQHRHYWFISLLLFLFIIFAALYFAKNKILNDNRTNQSIRGSSNLSILASFAIAFAISSVLTILLYRVLFPGGKEPWVIILSVLNFQPTRVIVYITCFILGVYGSSKDWFHNKQIPGNLFVWLFISLLLYAFFELSLKFKLVIPEIILRVSICYTSILTLVALGLKYWDNSSPINRTLANNSYNIYLIHIVFINLLQFVLFKWWSGFIIFKLIIVSVLSFILSYLVSQYAVRPFPRISITCFAGVFVVLLYWL